MKLLVVLLVNVIAIFATTPERIYSPHLLNNANNGVIIDTLTSGHSFGSDMSFQSSSGSSFGSEGNYVGSSFGSEGNYVGSSFGSEGNFVGSSFGQGQPQIMEPLSISSNYGHNTHNFGGISPCSSSNVHPCSIQGSTSQTSGNQGHSIHRVPIQVTKQVPVKSTRIVPMVTNNVAVALEMSTDTVCPSGSHLVDEVCEAIDSTPKCAPNFEWNGDRCIAISKSCPEHHKLVDDTCVPYFVCPATYTQKDDVCHPPKLPTPQCPYKFRWNGEICEIAQTVCKSGILKDGKCEQEQYDCPADFNKVGNQCIKRIPFCPTGYTMMSSGSCSRTTHRCPAGSYSQNNQCIKMEQNCPPGTTLNGNQCFTEELTFKTVYETKYVDQMIPNPTIPIAQPLPIVQSHPNLQPLPIIQPLPITSNCQSGACTQNACSTNTCVQNPCPLNTCTPQMYH